MTSDTILVTGGSGFLGGRIIAQALAAGYDVRTTVRSPDREPQVSRNLEAVGVTADDALTFVTADLTGDAGRPDAVADGRYVLHVASPFPGGEPAHEDELIVPAREGTLRVQAPTVTRSNRRGWACVHRGPETAACASPTGLRCRSSARHWAPTRDTESDENIG